MRTRALLCERAAVGVAEDAEEVSVPGRNAELFVCGGYDADPPHLTS